MPGVPENPIPDIVPPNPSIQEIFLLAGEQTLQLTKFDRIETGSAVLDSDAQRVLFLASTDRLGTNPSKNCQVFSVNTAASDLRQLTYFSVSDHSSRMQARLTARLDNYGCPATVWFWPTSALLAGDA